LKAIANNKNFGIRREYGMHKESALIVVYFICFLLMISCNAQNISVSNNVIYPSDHIIWTSDSKYSPHEAVIELNVTNLVNKEREPITMVLAIDSSGSMANSDPLNDRVEAAKKFVDLMAADKVDDQFGVVLGNGAVVEKLETTNNTEAVKKSIAKSEASDGTCIWEALNASDSLLQGETTNKKVVILFSDGHDECESSKSFIEKANEMKAKGIDIYAIGLGSSNIADLQAIGKYFHVSKPEDIGPVFEEVVARLKTSLENVEAIYQLPGGIEVYNLPVSASLTNSGSNSTLHWIIGPMYYQQLKTLTFDVKSDIKGTYILAMPNDSIVSYNMPNLGPDQAKIPPAEIAVDREANLFYDGRAIGGNAYDEFYPGYRIKASKDIQWGKFGCQDILINITTPKIPCNRTVVFAVDASGSILHGPYEDSMMGGIEDALKLNPGILYARVDWDFTKSSGIDYSSPTFISGSNWGGEWVSHPLKLYETDGTEYAAGLNRALPKIVGKKSLDTPFDHRITDYMIIFLTGKSEFIATGLNSSVANVASNGIPVYTIGLDINAADPTTMEEANVLQRYISNPTGGKFYPAINSRSDVAKIVENILSASCESRKDITAAGRVVVTETVYPYFRVLGTEPNAKSIKRNADGTTTIIFDLGNQIGETTENLIVHTAIDFSRLPIDVNATRTKVDFTPGSSTLVSSVMYTSMIDNTTRRTISLPEGELSIFCGEPCGSRSVIAPTPAEKENNTTEKIVVPVEQRPEQRESRFWFYLAILFAVIAIALAVYVYRRRIN
jgi:hypothetical protein